MAGCCGVWPKMLTRQLCLRAPAERSSLQKRSISSRSELSVLSVRSSGSVAAGRDVAQMQQAADRLRVVEQADGQRGTQLGDEQQGFAGDAEASG